MVLFLIPAVIGALCAASVLLAPSFIVHHEGLVLISGASTGIGRHAAEYLAASGYTVYAGVRKQSDFDAIVGLDNSKLLPINLDVTDHDSVVAAVNSLKDTMANTGLPLVAIVNNAGISRRTVAEFHSISDAKWVFETNFFGMMDLTQMALPLLRSSKGRILMISSLAGRIGNPTSSVYSASKFAMEGFSDSLRREVKRFGIPVSVIEPAYVTTEIFKKTSIKAEQSEYSLAAPDEVKALYPELHSAKAVEKKKREQSLASPATVTSEAIHHAVTSDKPHTRYVVANVGGLPAWILDLVAKYLPDYVVDTLYHAI